MAISSVAINSTDTTLLTVPVDKQYAITTIMVCNTSTPNPLDEDDGKTNFDMHFVAQGDPKSTINQVINELELPAGETFTFDSEKVVLGPGDSIVLVSDLPTTLSATASWLEV